MFVELPTEKQIKLIYDEFNTNKEEVNTRIKEIIRWLEDEPYLPSIKDEFFLRNYLLRCKYDMDRTKRTIERYYVTKAKMPDVFTKRDLNSDAFKKTYELGQFLPLPKLTLEGYRVAIYKVNGCLNEKMPSASEYVKNSQILGVVNMKVDLHKKCIIICDFNNISLSFVTLMLFCLKRLLSLNTKVIPFRFHKIYVMNAIPALEPLIAIAKMFAKKEVGDRIEIWKDKKEDFAKVLPADVLPCDYGGTEKSFQELSEEFLVQLRKYQTWLEEEEKDVADLKAKKKSKRTKTTEEDISFQNLNLD